MALPTLAARLDQLRWKFFEKGMQNVWNELKALANAANTTQLGSGVAFGTLAYDTNCNPDVQPRTVDESRGRSGTGGRYPQSLYPPTFAGFEA